MRDLKLYFKNRKGSDVEIGVNSPQYVFLEPLSSAVVRYVLRRTAVDGDSKLSNEVKETEVVSVKFLVPKTDLISKKSDFDGVEDRDKRTITLSLDFDSNNMYVLDALYTNKLDEKVKVKVIAHDTADEIMENEYSYVDSPDAFIRAVGVSINSTGVGYTLLYRRDGRVVMHPDKASYSDMAKLVKSILFLEGKYYSQVPPPTSPLIQEPKPMSVVNGLILEGWEISTTDLTRRDPISRTDISITDEELGEMIKRYISLEDLTALFKPLDINSNGHKFIEEGAKLLSKCDSSCSLPMVSPRLITDNRG